MNSGIYNDELYHHGILGQKWGIRRYQNYDGTLTQAGMKRYNKSLDDYNKKKSLYAEAKATKDKGKITNAKLALKKSKSQLNKDYKHLKQDKLADKGKELYANGYTITGNNRAMQALNNIGAISSSLFLLNQASDGELSRLINVGRNKLDNALLGIGLATVAITAPKAIIDYDRNKKLRAYYAHTSKY